jgi:uncharacterized membrane protein (DUF373 family)
MARRQDLYNQVGIVSSDEGFLKILKQFESITAKVLSIAMVLVLLVSIAQLIIFLSTQISLEPRSDFATTLIEIFGLFLNILVALEILQNITVYLKQHIIQIELVIATSLTAVARKIIIFDSQTSGLYLIALVLAIASLSFGYWLIRRTNRRYPA